MTHASVGSGHRQAVQDAAHFGVASINTVINVQQTLVGGVCTRLVEDAQHHVEAVVDLAM